MPWREAARRWWGWRWWFVYKSGIDIFITVFPEAKIYTKRPNDLWCFLAGPCVKCKIKVLHNAASSEVVVKVADRQAFVTTARAVHQKPTELWKRAWCMQCSQRGEYYINALVCVFLCEAETFCIFLLWDCKMFDELHKREPWNLFKTLPDPYFFQRPFVSARPVSEFEASCM